MGLIRRYGSDVTDQAIHEAVTRPLPISLTPAEIGQLHETQPPKPRPVVGALSGNPRASRCPCNRVDRASGKGRVVDERRLRAANMGVALRRVAAERALTASAP